MVDQEAEIEQHADRDEERGAEQDLQRHDLAEGVVAEPALADDQAGEERAERQADAGEAREPGRAEADRDDGEQEQLGRAGRATRSSSGGISRRATTSTTTMMAQRLAERAAQICALEPPPPASIGTSSTMTMIARSWKISRPSAHLPVRRRRSRRGRPSSLSTIAVDDSDTRKPVKSAARQSTPNAQQHQHVARLASTTWSPPPPKISVLIAPSLSRLNSMPMVKSSRMTPISAAALTSAGSSTSRARADR